MKNLFFALVLISFGEKTMAFPESLHPYAANTNDTQTYTVPDSPSSIIITFDTQSEVETGHDYIYIKDGLGNNIAGSPFTGKISYAGQLGGGEGIVKYIPSINAFLLGDFYNNTVRVIFSDGTIKTIAGSPTFDDYIDGTGQVARFAKPMGVVRDKSGTLFVADQMNNCIRKISAGGIVTTFAGDGSVIFGYTNGMGTAARFYEPTDLVLDTNDVIFVTDYRNRSIRKITTAGVVTTLAGRPSNADEQLDGTGINASFSGPYAITRDSSNNLYVLDLYPNSTIRKVTSGGVVTTFAGDKTSGGIVDGVGTAAKFKDVAGVTFSPGYLYTIDYDSATTTSYVRKITISSRLVETYEIDWTTVGAKRFYRGASVSSDSQGNLYVTGGTPTAGVWKLEYDGGSNKYVATLIAGDPDVPGSEDTKSNKFIVPGDTVEITLTSDGSQQSYGYTITDIQPYSALIATAQTSGLVRNLLISTDNGVNWSFVNDLNIPANPRTVAYGNDVWLVGGESNTNQIAWSADGQSWNPLGNIFGDLTDYFGTFGIRGLAFNGTAFVALHNTSPEAGEYNAFRSTDGINWTSVSTASFTGWDAGGYEPLGSSIKATNDGKFIITSEAAGGLVWVIISSDSGISWKAHLSHIIDGGYDYFATANIYGLGDPYTQYNTVVRSDGGVTLLTAFQGTGLVYTDAFGADLSTAELTPLGLDEYGTLGTLVDSEYSPYASFVDNPFGLKEVPGDGLWDGTQFVMVAQSRDVSTDYGWLATSPDGKTWTKYFADPYSVPTEIETFYKVAKIGDYYYICGASGSYSTVPIAFTKTVTIEASWQASNGPTVNLIYDIAGTTRDLIFPPDPTVVLADACNTKLYDTTLDPPTGVEAPYDSWVVSSGALPNGLVLDSQSGGLAGIIDDTPGVYTFSVLVTDSLANSGTTDYELTVLNTPVISTTTLPDGVRGSAYSQFILATNTEVTTTYVITQGSLPPGLSLDESTGEISGTPTKLGAWNFVIEVNNNEITACSDEVNLWIVVKPNYNLGKFYWSQIGATKQVQFVDNCDSQNKPIVSWLWNFGDGSTSTEQDPIHEYAEYGTPYDVTLTATNSIGEQLLDADPVQVDIGNVETNPPFDFWVFELVNESLPKSYKNNSYTYLLLNPYVKSS